MPSNPLETLVLVPGAVIDPRSLARDVRRGIRVRIKRGAYLDAAAWSALDPAARHLVRIHCFARSHPGSVFSHHSAAVVHGLPLVGVIPDKVHVTTQRARGGRSEPGLIRHCVGLDGDEIVESEGVCLTSLPRTVVDLAIAQPFRFAMAPLDHVIGSRKLDAAALRGYLTRHARRRGVAAARRAVDFADPRAANAGESLSRATIHELGFAPPDLQVRHTSMTGRRYDVDFEWADQRVIGEFDGKGKYFKSEYLGSMTSGDAVYAEKRREDELRLEGMRFARWGWYDAMEMNRLRNILLRVGLPLERPFTGAVAMR